MDLLLNGQNSEIPAFLSDADWFQDLVFPAGGEGRPAGEWHRVEGADAGLFHQSPERHGGFHAAGVPRPCGIPGRDGDATV